MGPIALLGSGEFDPWTEDLDRALLEAAEGDGSVAILPAASAPEGSTFSEWAHKGLEHYSRLGVPAQVVELKGREDAERPDLARRLERSSVIFFSGGNPAYLARVLGGSALWEAIVSAVRRGGAYAGCSAGACVAGEFAPDSVTEHVWDNRWTSGLRLVPKVWVIPHFDVLDEYRVGLRDYFLARVPPDDWAIGIDERSALARFGERWHVFGLGGVLVRHGDIAFRAGAGESFTLGPPATETGAVDPDLVTILDTLPAGAGPIGMLSAEQFSPGSIDVDRAMLDRTGPRVGVVLAADPSNADAVARAALEYYGDLGADARIISPDDEASGIDLLFLAGGDPSNLLPALDGRELWLRALEGWRQGLGLAGSSAGAMVLCEHCLLPMRGSALPTTWGRGLGPMRSFALAVHASTRPDWWLEQVRGDAPVPLVAMDDPTAMLLAPGEPPVAFGDGGIRPIRATGPTQPGPPMPAVTHQILRLYHRTNEPTAILSGGFVDSTANPSREGAWEGTWFADRPLDVDSGIPEGPVLVLEVPAEVAARYEWRDPAKPYREFILPRTIADRYGPPRILRPGGTLRDPGPIAIERADEAWPEVSEPG